jgi:hypothetical protein
MYDDRASTSTKRQGQSSRIRLVTGVARIARPIPIDRRACTSAKTVTPQEEICQRVAKLIGQLTYRTQQKAPEARDSVADDVCLAIAGSPFYAGVYCGYTRQARGCADGSMSCLVRSRLICQLIFFHASAEMLDPPSAACMKTRQPCEALEPGAFAVEAVERWALEKAWHLSADRFRLTSLWYIDFIIQHAPGERKTRYAARLAQSENYGIAFSLTSALRDIDEALALRESDHGLVGEDSRQILKDRRYRNDMDRTALIDLVMGHVSAVADDHAVLDQTRPEKYVLKSRLFSDEAEVVLKRKGVGAIKGGKPHVLVIGAMAGTIAALLARGYEVSATDMSPDVVGRNLGGVTVSHGAENRRLIEAADLAIITGMTLPNRSLPSIVEDAKRSNTSTMMWSVTGKNLGHYYIEHGVDCVVSDPLPFLMLPGPFTIGIWRRNR